MSFVGTLAPSSELHRSRKTSSQQPITRANQRTCGVQLGPLRTIGTHCGARRVFCKSTTY